MDYEDAEHDLEQIIYRLESQEDFTDDKDLIEAQEQVERASGDSYNTASSS